MELENIYITVMQGKTEITKQKDKNELTVEDDLIYATLSQEDTLKLSQGYAYVQMRAVDYDGNAVASNVEMVPVKKILKDGVIT